VLQQEDRLRVEQVQLTLATPLVLATDLQPVRVGGARRRPGERSACTPASPTPPIRLGVPRKYLSMSRLSRPTASNTCAPQYDETVEMPILDMILRTPLPSALA
jgi:hypothetical protein